MITNIYIKQLFHILKKYGQVHLFKAHITMDKLATIVATEPPHRYFRRINTILFSCGMKAMILQKITDEYDEFISQLYKKDIIKYLNKENLYDSIKYEYEREDNSWRKYDSFEEYLENSRWFDVLACAFDWDKATEGYDEYERINDYVIQYIGGSQKENW